MNQNQLDAYHGHLDFARSKVTRSRYIQPWERGFLKQSNPFATCPPAHGGWCSGRICAGEEAC